MTKINLLPWREERRQELKRQFYVILAGMVLLGAGAVYLVDMNVQSKIENQRARNAYIIAETKKLEVQIKEIEEIKKKRARLIERMNVIQDLQGNRPVIVHLFDQMAKTLPDGVFYTSVSSTGGVLSIKGIAESNNKVSNLMRSLDASPLFVNPNLSNVSAIERNGERWVSFSLTVKQGRPADTSTGKEG